jgi:hypothetical protein
MTQALYAHMNKKTIKNMVGEIVSGNFGGNS